MDKTYSNTGGIGEGLTYAAANVGIGAAGIVEGVTDLVSAAGYALTGQTDKAKAQFLDSWSGQWKRQLDDWYNPNAVMSFVGDVGQGVGNSLIAAIPYAGLPAFFVGAAGGGISSAAEKTGDVGLKEIGYGLTSGIIEGMLEKYVGPGAASVKGIGTKALSSLTKSTTKSAVRNSVVKQMLSNMGEEFLEESLSEMIDPLMQRLYQIDPTAATSFPDVIRAGIIGGISGGILGGAQIGLGAAHDSSVGRTIAANGNSATIKHTAEAMLSSPFFTDQNGIKDEGILDLAGTLNSYNELTPDKLASGEGYRLLGAMKRQIFSIEARTKSAPYRRELEAQAEKTAAYATKFYGKTYTAEDIKADKDGVLTNLTVLRWAGDAEVQARAAASVNATRAEAMAKGGLTNNVQYQTAAEMEAEENGTDTATAEATAETVETVETPVSAPSANSQAIENLVEENGAVAEAVAEKIDLATVKKLTAEDVSRMTTEQLNERYDSTQERKNELVREYTAETDEERRREINRAIKKLQGDMVTINTALRGRGSERYNVDGEADADELGAEEVGARNENANEIEDDTRESDEIRDEILGGISGSAEPNAEDIGKANDADAEENDADAGIEALDDSDLIKPDARTKRMLGSYEASVVEKARKLLPDFDLLSFERKVAVCELIDTSPNMGRNELRAMCVLVAGRDGLFAYSSPTKHRGVHKVLAGMKDRRLIVLSNNENVISGEGKGNVVGETIFHEIVHDIKALDENAFMRLAKVAFKYVTPKMVTEIQDRYTEHFTGTKFSEWAAKKENEGKGLSDFIAEHPSKLTADIVAEEVVAGYIGKAFADTRYVKYLGDTSPKTFKWVAKTFNTLFRYLFGKNRFAERALIDVYGHFTNALAETQVKDIWNKSTVIYQRYDEDEDMILPSEGVEKLNLAAVAKHKQTLQEKYTNSASVPIETLMERYDAIVKIWEELSGELDSEFLRQWNAKGKDKAFTVFKAQAGYKYNIELSSMCKKGVPLFEAIDTIVRKEVLAKMNDPVLDKRAKEILYDILKSKGFEIPCAICYVEQARQREGVIIRDFLQGIQSKDKLKIGWNTLLGEVEQEMAKAGVEYHFPKLDRSVSGEAYTPAANAMTEVEQKAYYDAMKKLLNREIKRYNEAEKKSRPTLKAITAEEIKRCLGGTLPANLKLFKVLLSEPNSRFTIDGDLLYSSVTTHNLAAYHTQLYSLFNAQGGVSGYKTKQQPIAYWGELLGKSWKLSTVRESGGIRNQSNSDGQMYTLLDLAQMYIDATAKGFYIQAYTKVLAELRLFGLSRAKINASLIPRVRTVYNPDGTVNYERTQENAGLDANGEPIYDDFEGIPHEEAFDILSDPEYSKSVGGVCIGYSDNHILKLLDDGRIQLIIGFHDKTNDPNKRYRGARFAKNYNGLNEAVNAKGETVHIGFNQFVIKAEKMFKKGKNGPFSGTADLNGKTYEPNDIPRLAADLYLEHCAEKGYRPAYSGIDGSTDFSKHKNYYKLLADFSLYDSTGAYAPHQKVEFKLPDSVPVRGEDGAVDSMKSKDYIKKELQKELAVRDGISEALADESEDGVIKQFEKRMREQEESIAYINAPENIDVIALVDKVKKGAFAPNEKIYFGMVTNELVKKIKELTGVDATGYKIAIEARQIEHILKDHGEKGKSDKSMADSSDISKMEYVIDMYDDISRGMVTSAYKNFINGQTRLAQTILYEKWIGEKSYYVVQAVPDTKAKTLFVVSAFIGEKGYKKEAPQFANVSNLGATSVIGTANASGNSIHQNTPIVNSSTQNNSGNSSADDTERLSLDTDNIERVKKHVLGNGTVEQLKRELKDRGVYADAAVTAADAIVKKHYRKVIDVQPSATDFKRAVLHSFVLWASAENSSVRFARTRDGKVYTRGDKQNATRHFKVFDAHNSLLSELLPQYEVDESLWATVRSAQAEIEMRWNSKDETKAVQTYKELRELFPTVFTVSAEEVDADSATEIIRKIRGLKHDDLASKLSDEQIKAAREAFAADIKAHATELSSALGMADKELQEERRIHGYKESLMGTVRDMREMLKDKRIGAQEADALVMKLINRVTTVNPEASSMGDKSYVEVRDEAIAKNLAEIEEIINGLLHDLDEAEVLSETELTQNGERTVFEQYVPRDLMDEIRVCATRVASKKGERITADEYELIARMMLGIKQWYHDYDMVWFDGRMRKRSEIINEWLESSYDIVRKKGESDKKTGVKNFLKNWFKEVMKCATVGLLDTHAVWAGFDGYRANGLFTRLWDQLEQSMSEQAILKERILAERDAFFRKHKDFELELKTRKVEYQNHEITLGEAITIFMTAKREQAFLALYGSDLTVMSDPTFHFKGKGFEGASEEHIRSDIKLRMAELKNAIGDSAAVNEYIKIAERFFNETSKSVKRKADESYFGYTNVEEGYYIPITRDKSAFSPDMLSAGGQIDQFISLTSLPFNKHTIKNAKAALVIGNINDLFNRHADGLSKYATMYQPVNAVNRILGRQITVKPDVKNGREIWLMEKGDSGSPNSIMKILTDSVWDGDAEKAKKYFRNLLNATQGFSQKQYNAAQKLVDYIVKNATVNALGLNIKSVMSQLAAIPMAGYSVSPANLLKGLSTIAGKIKELKAEAELMDKYSVQAHSRNIDSTGIRSSALLDKMGHSAIKGVNTLNKLTEATMVPISATDRFTFLVVWEAAQHQAESAGYAIGTEENLKMAGKIVDEFAKMTQPTVSAANSAAARTDNLLAKTFMRFTSATNKMFSRMVECIGRYLTLKDAKRNKLADISDKEIAEAGSQARRMGGAIVASNIMLVGLIQLFKFAFAKDRDDDETVAEDILGDTVDSFVGMVPVLSQVYGFFKDGYEISDLSFDAINDTLKALQDTGKIFTATVTGEVVESTEVARVVRNGIYNLGAMFGIPVRNTWNNVTGLIKRVSPTAGANINAIFYDPTSTDLTAALMGGDEALAETVANLMLARRGGEVDYAAAKEFVSLYSAEKDGAIDAYNLMPRTAKEEISVDGRKYVLNAKQYKTFKQIYGGVTNAISELVAREDYKLLTEEGRAKAIKSLYSLYYSKATTAALGTAPTKSEVISSFVSDTTGYVSALAYASGISGDDRKDKILAYLQKSGLSADDKTWVLASLGYKAELEKVIQLIKRSKLTAEEKANAYAKLGIKDAA